MATESKPESQTNWASELKVQGTVPASKNKMEE